LALPVLLHGSNAFLAQPLHGMTTARGAAEIVQQLVPGDASQPGAEILATAIALQVAKRREKDILRDIVHVVQMVDLTGKITAQRQREDLDHATKGIRASACDLIEDGVDVGTVSHDVYLSANNALP